MKRILLIAVLLGTMITATTYFVCIAAPSVLFGKGIKGSGNIVTRTIDAPDFDRVDAARAVKVVITGKATDKITIQADDNIMEYVVVEAKGGRLTATIDKSVNNVSNADVTVTVPANGRIRRIERRTDHERGHADGRQILDRRIECRQDRRGREIDLLHSGRIERLEHRRRHRNRLLHGRGIERLEDHPEGLRRQMQHRHELGRKTFGRRIHGRRLQRRHLERCQSYGQLHGQTPRRGFERQFDPLHGRLPDQHQQIERRQRKQEIIPQRHNYERG